MENLLVVGIGGFLGANARYLMTLWIGDALPQPWGNLPLGTLAVNALGSFGLALFGLWFAGKAGLSPQVRLLMGAGFFGAFTTFSTFASESVALLQSQGSLTFLLNIILNNGICLAGVILGLALGSRLFAAA